MEILLKINQTNNNIKTFTNKRNNVLAENYQGMLQSFFSICFHRKLLKCINTK